MSYRKLRKTVTVSVLIVSVFAGSILAGAKTKTVQLMEGECYKLPKKASSIVVKNKKVVKLFKNKKIKALKKGRCRVAYVKSGKKFSLKVVVTKPKKSSTFNEQAFTPEVKPEPVATPVPTPVPTQSINNQSEAKPTQTPWGTDVHYIYNLVITNMEPGDNEKETILYCENLGDDYVYNELFLYKIYTKKLICTVLSESAQKFKIGDYVRVDFCEPNHVKIPVEVKDDVTIIGGISWINSYTPVKKNATPTPVINSTPKPTP